MRFVPTILLLVATPLWAAKSDQGDQTFDPTGLTQEQLAAKVADKSDPWFRHPCSVGIPLFDELHHRNQEDEAHIRGQLYATALCDDEKHDFIAGLAHTKELETRFPDYNWSSLGLYFALRSENAAEFLDRLRALDDNGLRKLDPSRFWAGFRMVRKQGLEAELENLALDWVDQRKLGILSADIQSSIAVRAMNAAIRADRLSLVSNLLLSVRSPLTYIDLLFDRRYERIWPQIEQRAGKNLAIVGEEYADWALARLENNKRDRDRFSVAAHALHYAGQFEDAAALARDWRERDGAMDAIEEGDAWALNIEAYANDALGRPEEADKVFDQLAALDPNTHPWVVNFVINRASRLVGQERWEDGLEATKLAQSVAERYGSPYAKMIIAKDRTCALIALGRKDEIEPELAFLRDNITESYREAAQGLMCAGLREEAARLLIEGIRDERFRYTALATLQSSQFDLFYTPSKLPQPNELLAESSELKAAFETYARIIPAEFVPVASLRANR